MIYKLKMTSNRFAFRIPLNNSRDVFTKLRITNIWYKLAAANSDLQITFERMCDKIDNSQLTPSHYTLYMPLSTYTGTIAIYSNNQKIYDYETETPILFSEFNITALIDYQFIGISALNPLIIEFELI